MMTRVIASTFLRVTFPALTHLEIHVGVVVVMHGRHGASRAPPDVWFVHAADAAVSWQREAPGLYVRRQGLAPGLEVGVVLKCDVLDHIGVEPKVCRQRALQDGRCGILK